MSDTVQFTGCKYLDYRRDKYVPEVTMNLIDHFATTKVCWDRQDIDGNWQLCQFCQKRGRINRATGCLRKEEAACGDYEEVAHTVNLSDVNLE